MKLDAPQHSDTSQKQQAGYVVLVQKLQQWQWWLPLSVLALLLLYGVRLLTIPPVGSDSSAPPIPRKKEAVAVVVAPVVLGDVPVYVSGLGTVTGLRTVTVKARVDGELVRVGFHEGTLVNEGDLIAEIDPRPFEIQLMQVEGQLLRDEALLKNAQLDLERYQLLLAQDSIAAQQAATQKAVVKQYQGIVITDKALVANAKLQLSYAQIKAPITGRIGLRSVDQGNIVKASDTGGIVVITQTQPIAVVFTLPEDQIPAVMKQLRLGKAQQVEAYDRSGKNKLAEGRLLAVDNQIDPNTGTIKLKSLFENKDTALFANQFVNIKMKIETLHQVMIVPSAALQIGNAGAFVYVVNDDQTVAIRTVKVGVTVGEQVVVLDGLKLNDRVVVEGTDRLREHANVNVLEGSRTVNTPPPLSKLHETYSPRQEG